MAATNTHQTLIDHLFDLDEALTLANCSSATLDLSMTLPDMPTVADADSVCSVCVEPFRQDSAGKQLPCGHVFHASCISDWIFLRNSCPICRDIVCRKNVTGGNV
ncbi:hypothetical protein Nepgr_018361 [Nepenthes gracilis]|uniref:RING-type domain-containing protein n=1 Tax=Nepenthes gracilis TaxID=150966 RepID=A0AAD3SR81_NEPGR|nr:hypothetical protein Nepgr_018361 [Nepenthes gracilis]